MRRSSRHGVPADGAVGRRGGVVASTEERTVGANRRGTVVAQEEGVVAAGRRGGYRVVVFCRR